MRHELEAVFLMHKTIPGKFDYRVNQKVDLPAGEARIISWRNPGYGSFKAQALDAKECKHESMELWIAYNFGGPKSGIAKKFSHCKECDYVTELKLATPQKN